MANKMFRLGILVVALVFGMTVVGCGGSSSDGGVFTLTDIPAEYNGKYALFDGSFTDTGEDFVGCMNFNLSTEEITTAKISNGSTNIPVWTITNRGSLTRYSGNETAILEVMIVDSGTVIADEFDAVQIKLEVAFSSGSATKSFYEGELY